MVLHKMQKTTRWMSSTRKGKASGAEKDAERDDGTLSAKITCEGRGCGRDGREIQRNTVVKEKRREREKKRREEDVKGRGGGREIGRGLGERRASSSRMTIISGHWVHGAWRLSFAPYSHMHARHA